MNNQVNGQYFLNASSKFEDLGTSVNNHITKILLLMRNIGKGNTESIKLEKILDYINRYAKIVGINLSDIYKDVGLNIDKNIESKTMVAYGK